jgi:hypothetical protein
MRKSELGLILLLGVGPAACGEDPAAPASCNLAQPAASCHDALVCEDVGGQPTCVAPLVVRGRIVDPAGRGIVGALVTALDANEAAATGTATSGADGAFELRLPIARTAAGAPVTTQVRLRAAAAGFETFPSGLRRSLPLEVSGAVLTEGKLVFASTSTDVILMPVANPQSLGAIAGTVNGTAGGRGVLVVAEGPAVGTAISDTDGKYVIFNLPPGAYSVRGYAADVQLGAAAATTTAGATTGGVNLLGRDVPTGNVKGSVNIVNAPGGSMTSVVLVVASTFNEALKRGEVPPGLRSPRAGSPSVTGPFTLAGVPDGNYVVLAAFENDQLVRDPDTSIGGTQIQRITVGDAGREVNLGESFKITEALTVMHPGAGEIPEAMTGVPSFTWKDDSSEDRYELEVFDWKGNSVWKTGVAKQTGGDVNATYAGPALQAAMLYQFRVTSIRRDVPISQTEDLKGVFLVQ